MELQTNILDRDYEEQLQQQQAEGLLDDSYNESYDIEYQLFGKQAQSASLDKIVEQDEEFKEDDDPRYENRLNLNQEAAQRYTNEYLDKKEEEEFQLNSASRYMGRAYSAGMYPGYGFNASSDPDGSQLMRSRRDYNFWYANLYILILIFISYAIYMIFFNSKFELVEGKNFGRFVEVNDFLTETLFDETYGKGRIGFRKYRLSNEELAGVLGETDTEYATLLEELVPAAKQRYKFHLDYSASQFMGALQSQINYLEYDFDNNLKQPYIPAKAEKWEKEHYYMDDVAANTPMEALFNVKFSLNIVPHSHISYGPNFTLDQSLTGKLTKPVKINLIHS